MSLDHAILGFLQYKPLSGYDLKAVFDDSVRHFWPADQSQIYRTLSKLADNGWLEVEVIEQNERPDRKVYHITESGRDELMRWLTSPIPEKRHRFTELVQVFFAGHLPDDEVMSMFQRFADHFREVIAHLEALPCGESKHGADLLPDRDRFLMMLTLDYGITNAKANLEWVERAIARLKNGEFMKGECR